MKPATPANDPTIGHSARERVVVVVSSCDEAKTARSTLTPPVIRAALAPLNVSVAAIDLFSR